MESLNSSIHQIQHAKRSPVYKLLQERQAELNQLIRLVGFFQGNTLALEGMKAAYQKIGVYIDERNPTLKELTEFIRRESDVSSGGTSLSGYDLFYLKSQIAASNDILSIIETGKTAIPADVLQLAEYFEDQWRQEQGRITELAQRSPGPRPFMLGWNRVD